MRDISMHVLDIVMNSIHANSTLIEIVLNEQTKQDFIEVVIKDNGKGMDEETLKKVLNPFYTTRTTRKVGLGLPLLAENVKRTCGVFSIESEINKGTKINAKFMTSHIDCIPVGDINETILSLIILEPTIDFVYEHKLNDQTFVLDTREVKEVIEDIPINNGHVINWLKENLLNQF